MYNAAPPLPEARSSVNVHVDIGGRRVQVTLRDHDESRLLERLAVVLERFPVDAPPSDTPANPIPPDLPTDPAPVEDWCPIHNTPMTLRSNERGEWWSHYVEAENRYCKGRKR